MTNDASDGARERAGDVGGRADGRRGLVCHRGVDAPREVQRLCGMAYGEIAARMQRSEGAVRNLVHRGLSRLALRLGELRREDGDADARSGA